MIVMLTGIVAERIDDVVVLDVHGVGYGLAVTAEDYGRLEKNSDARLYIYEHIREQSHDLYGFVTLETKQLFELLLGVNGVGPKMALNMLSIGTSGEVRAAIANGDVKFMQRATGVGKRVAERVVLDLKDKVGVDGSGVEVTDFIQPKTSKRDEAAEALIALGYTPQDAVQALQGIAPDVPVEERVRRALQGERQ